MIEVDTEFAGDLIVNLTSLVGDVTVDPAFSSMFSILHTDKQTHSTERFVLILYLLNTHVSEWT